jgi:hypothetical protein
MSDDVFAEKPLAEDLIWGAAAIGDEIGVNRRKAYHLLENDLLPARKVGDLWVASRRALRRALAGE